jgi:hypothetical protein
MVDERRKEHGLDRVQLIVELSKPFHWVAIIGQCGV